MTHNNRTEISTLPLDKPDCICKLLVDKAIRSGITTSYLACPRRKQEGMNPYDVVCTKCGNVVAQLYATDEKASDWCDLHSICFQVNGKWQGALAVNVSPIDSTLGFECTCGNDTRDFRASNGLPQETLMRKLKETKTGRTFGTKSSKFKLRKK
jgi:hypothetical protein